MKWLSWTFDYYISYMMYGVGEMERYDNYMTQKWGKKYTDLK